MTTLRESKLNYILERFYEKKEELKKTGPSVQIRDNYSLYQIEDENGFLQELCGNNCKCNANYKVDVISNFFGGYDAELYITYYKYTLLEDCLKEDVGYDIENWEVEDVNTITDTYQIKITDFHDVGSIDKYIFEDKDIYLKIDYMVDYIKDRYDVEPKVYNYNLKRAN